MGIAAADGHRRWSSTVEQVVVRLVDATAKAVPPTHSKQTRIAAIALPQHLLDHDHPVDWLLVGCRPISDGEMVMPQGTSNQIAVLFGGR